MAVGEKELLVLLNSAPVIDGAIVETLQDATLRTLRDDLHAVIRGTATPKSLEQYLTGVSQRPHLDDDGVSWTLEGRASALSLAEYVLTWSQVERELPGRLRGCANDECNKFLIDHSKPNSARWCSMAECGNRMKARRHHARQIPPARTLAK
jgi:predicted RNA-binding Zn ribbon-like protein